MTKDSDISVPDSRIDRIKYSITNLWDTLGRTDKPLLGLVINLGVALICGVVWFYTSGIVAFGSAVIAILSVLAVIRWVVSPL